MYFFHSQAILEITRNRWDRRKAKEPNTGEEMSVKNIVQLKLNINNILTLFLKVIQ